MAVPLRQVLRRLQLALLAALLALLLPAAPAAADGSFQRVLDRYGIPFEVPERGKAIIVNIPAYELVAFEDGVPVLRSTVIVGTPWNPTPVLRTHTTTVRFRPTWRPTPEMVASGEYEDRLWPPGPTNPLGLAAIRLESGLLVYLHDTNRRDLFDQPARALSHGCIRVQLWDRLIAWLLDTDLATVHALGNGSRTFDWPTPPIPVTLAYLRVWPHADGRVLRHPDIYGLAPDPARPGPAG